MRNEVYVISAGKRDRRRQLHDLIVAVAASRVIYERPLRQVAFDAVDPTTALAEAETKAEKFVNDYTAP
jgi:hypothetical protein